MDYKENQTFILKSLQTKRYKRWLIMDNNFSQQLQKSLSWKWNNLVEKGLHTRRCIQRLEMQFIWKRYLWTSHESCIHIWHRLKARIHPYNTWWYHKSIQRLTWWWQLLLCHLTIILIRYSWKVKWRRPRFNSQIC